MDGSALRLAVGGLVGVAALSVVGLVTLGALGRGVEIAASLAGLGGTCLGILGNLVLPSGRGSNGSVPVPGPPVVPFQSSPAADRAGRPG